jgi:hypothetical protein
MTRLGPVTNGAMTVVEGLSKRAATMLGVEEKAEPASSNVGDKIVSRKHMPPGPESPDRGARHPPRRGGHHDDAAGMIVGPFEQQQQASE